MKEKEKPKYSILQNLGYLLRQAWGASKLFLFTTLATAILTLCVNLTQLYIAPVILRKVEQTAPLAELLAAILLFTLALLVFSALLAYLNSSSNIGVTELYSHFMVALTEKLCATSYPNTLDTAFLRRQQQAERAMLGNSTAVAPVAMLSEAGRLLTALGGFAAYLLVLTGLEPVLLLVVLATTAAGFFVSRYLNGWDHRHQEERGEYQQKIRFVTNTVMGNEMAKDLRLFHMRDWLLELHDKALALYRGYCSRREGWYMLAKGVDVILSAARNGIAYLYLIHMALQEGLPASLFLLYFSAVTGFTGWVTDILNGVIQLRRSSLRLSEIREVLDWPEPFLFEQGKPVPRAEDGRYELRLEDVSYRYPEADRDSVSHVDLTIRPGEKLAVVGLNGAGKTTLVKLLCGLLDPTQGRVLLNGQDIRQYDRRDYYAMFTAVFQDFSCLQATLAVNVAQSGEPIDYDRVRDCIDRAGFADTVAKLPKGVYTNLGRAINEDGIELSGGQEQRLMLARALYKDAPLLILDEPTAALDPIAENDMYLRYHELTRGRTAVYISHRLASTRFCDRVLFLADGRIAEEGTHQELMAAGGGYAKLFRVQSKYYREGGTEREEIE